MPPAATLEPLPIPSSLPPVVTAISFSHVQIYTSQLSSLKSYKNLESQLNTLSSRLLSLPLSTITTPLSSNRPIWQSVKGRENIPEYRPQNRDIIKQLLSSFGFRVSAHHSSTSTQSFLVTSPDPTGAKFVVTAPLSTSSLSQTNPPVSSSNDEEDLYSHFSLSDLQNFQKCHGGRGGIAVLAFSVSSTSSLWNRYTEKHPALLKGRWDYDSEKVKIVEVYAYYRGENPRVADTGTVLRFVQSSSEEKGGAFCLPGFSPIKASFSDDAFPAYADHWVSNVHSRVGFLKILEETLGFAPKVDFNAGVVAAGEAQIESTVTGNSAVGSVVEGDVLKDQNQVYLPINNALSRVGHVHGFLEELGQGVQHVASRVDDLIDFVQRGNDYREITGEGFTFLDIPRSYYGILSRSSFPSTLSPSTAQFVLDACEKNLLTPEGAVKLHLTRNDVRTELRAASSTILPENRFDEYEEEILDGIVKSRYENLYTLLGDNLTEERYLGIVRNKILVDVQGDDLLFQIFTSNILQKNAGDEAPFLEFIQRVCGGGVSSNSSSSSKKTRRFKPGCGGFGIRNFLTLFLSIEVSKAMHHLVGARKENRDKDVAFYSQMVEVFTKQLNESNPILTKISNAMIEEGEAREKLLVEGEDNFFWSRTMEEAREKKERGNEELMRCSEKYKQIMRSLREGR